MSIPIAREGAPFIAVPAALAAGSLALHFPAGAAAATALALFMAWFFRDPERTPPREPGLVVSPADGRVLRVAPEGEGTRIAIFMSPWNVHVNRAPVTGRVVDRSYRPGRFRPAQEDRAAIENEHNLIVVEGEEGKVSCLQVAGFLARRIVCRVGPGDRVARGERYGMIRFGSRMEVVVPAGLRVAVAPGDRVLAGESVLARRGGGEP